MRSMPLLALVSGVLAIVPIACCAPSRQSTCPEPAPGGHMAQAEELHQAAVQIIDADPARAEQYLRSALEVDPFHGPALNNLGTILLRRREFYQAATAFEQARKLLPGHPDPRMNLGLTFESAGRLEDATHSYRSALEVSPDYIPAMQALARLQVRTGRTGPSTAQLLKEVALRGETAEWREWAVRQLTSEQ